MKIWILTHYAVPPSMGMGGVIRHYYFTKYLAEKGHELKLFTASKIHNSTINMIKGKELYSEQVVEGVPYTFVKSSDYHGNGLSRIWNMLEFPFRLWKSCNKFSLPDVIYTSSPDIFTAFTALLYARKKGIPCVVEVRDLWPESIVEYKGMSRKNPIILALYWLEKWIYQHADRLIFTMEGGPDYIRERGWEGKVDLSKIYHINNGVDLDEFDWNRKQYQLKDADLENTDTFKMAYTGVIRLVNNLGLLVDTAKLLQEQGHEKIKFLIWGQGDELEALRKRVKQENITNICFKGFVDKKYIPFILSKVELNLMHSNAADIMRFGSSPNKLFDYLAAEKPILLDRPCNYDLISRYNCGISISNQSAQQIANAVLEFVHMPLEKRAEMGKRARKAVEDYDYRRLAEKLETVLKDAST